MTGDTDWDAEAYDEDHTYVADEAADLVSVLDPAPGDRVLDVGCGTGRLTAAVDTRAAGAVGIDSAPSMVDRAREQHEGPTFLQADVRALPFDSHFDAALSNAALHWIPRADQDAALTAVRDALRPGGRLVAELGGAGNVADVVTATRSAVADAGYDPPETPWHFPTLGGYTSRLERAGFEPREARLFDRPTPLDGGEAGLANWLGAFGDVLLDPVPATEVDAVVADVADRLRPDRFRDGTWVLGYRRLRVVAVAAEPDAVRA